MAKPAICIPCDMTFPSEEAFQAHKASGHAIMGQPLHEESKPRITLDQAQKLEELDQAKQPPQELPPGVPPDALPTPEFLEAVKRIEGDAPADPTAIAEHKAEMQKIMDQKVAEDNKPALPIELTYLYTGECQLDKGRLTTIELEVDKKHFVTAICETCHKQQAVREVAQL